MYQRETHHELFNLEDDEQMRKYTEIVNNPLCVIIEERKFTKTAKSFEDGKLSSVSVTEYLSITWQEKSLL